MNKFQKIALSSLLILLIVALAAILYTRDWEDSPRKLHVDTVHSMHRNQLVDTRALETAQQLAPLAVTRWEQDYAQEALRLADHSVDLAFAAALEDARDNPPAETTETRALAKRLLDLEARVSAETLQVAQLTAQLAKAAPNQKDALQEDLDLVNAQLALDDDELDDAHQDLTRAGGDRRALIQQQLDEHEASQTRAAKAAQSVDPSASPEASHAKSLVTQTQALFSLRAKISLLEQARQNALDRAAKDSAAHDSLEKDLGEEKVQKKVVRAHPHGGTSAVSVASTAAPASPAPAPDSAPSTSGPVGAKGEPISQLNFLKHLGVDQKNLAAYDKRIEDEQALAVVYANWLALVEARSKALIHGVLLCILWIVLIALFIFIANFWVQRFLSDLSIDRREMHAIRAVILFAVQAVGIVLILLVVFGIPNNFATIAALAGAGITVAMKDFIVGFFGWFILMGPNGIKPGDWVEINGVGGEVLAVGLLHTVILETGSWSDAGHPTGRKVTFVNSFAIEGHYFNFSTSGQWLWDEIQVQVPGDKDPYKLAEDIQKIATDETEANAKTAEHEWERVTTHETKKSFSTLPSMSVRPTGSGVDVRVRYLTRANERHEVRARLYRSVLDLLHSVKIPETAAVKPTT
jgi:small-conductance mechanosensitive channel